LSFYSFVNKGYAVIFCFIFISATYIIKISHLLVF
jgi:hypothetical protein